MLKRLYLLVLLRRDQQLVRRIELRSPLTLSSRLPASQCHYPSSTAGAIASPFSPSSSSSSAAAADLPKSRVARLMGIGKMMVELCSAAMLFSVCR